MTNDPHPFGYTVAMRQAMLTAAFVIGGAVALATPSLFATSFFANAYVAAADSMNTGFLVAEIGTLTTPSISTDANASQQPPQHQMMQNNMPQNNMGGMNGDNQNGQNGQNQNMGRPNMPRQIPPAEIVKALVAAGIIPQEKAEAAIEVLRKTMMAQSGTNEKVCFVFNRMLRLGDRGEDVKQLNQMLKSEGFDVTENTDEYSEQTSSAVTGLQEKYHDEILTPAGLKFGTGLVGKGTIMKLNKLRNCAAAAQGATQDSSTGTIGQPGAGAGNPAQMSPEMMKKRIELEQKYREMCKDGKCPDTRMLLQGANGTKPPLPPKPPTTNGATTPAGATSGATTQGSGTNTTESAPTSVQ